MKKYHLKSIFFAAAMFAANVMGAQTMLLEGEDFQLTGDWNKGKFPNSREYIIEAGFSKFAPLTAVDFKKAGKYDVWVSAVDFAENSPRTRNYFVEIDGKALEKKAGMHGRDGLYWEKLGTVNLDKGEHIIQLRPAGSFGRCDAVVFTTDENFDPNAVKLNRKKIKIEPKELKCEMEDYFIDIPALSDVESPAKFEASNADYKVAFTQKKDPKGKVFFERSASLLKDGKWIEQESFKDELFFIYYLPKIELRDTSYFAIWSKSKAKARANVNGSVVTLDIAPSNPYAIGDISCMRVVSVKNRDARTLELALENGALAVMTLPEKGQCAKFDLSYKAPKNGYYSFGFKTFNEVRKGAVLAAFMPTPYQGKRLMKEPKMMTTTLMSQPLSFIQKSNGEIDITSGVIGNPECLPFEWSRHGDAVYGFSLAAPNGLPQAVSFQPIFGGRNSLKKAGEEISASWYALNIVGDWRDAFDYVNSNIFASSKVRESYGTSFSDALANIGQYLKDGEFSGWAPRHKARWNIEGDDLVTHASPMAEVEAALLRNDEEYYKNVALPTIEYTLSRKGAHFRTFRTDIVDYGMALHELGVPSKLWTPDYYAGLDSLLGGKNAWLYEFTKKPDGKLDTREASTPSWTQKLGYYIVNPSPELLEEIKKDCDAWIKREFEKKYAYEPNFVSFINYGLYPYWWYLPEMYKVTGDKKYLDYAEKGAFFTLSGLWNFPTPPDGDVTINKGNFANGVAHLWWRGREKFREGAETSLLASKTLRDAKVSDSKYPFFAPEKKVDAGMVSRIGVGIEQHSTYIGGCYNILMPSWSAEMLKVYQHDKRDVLMKFSRHAIIGRYANFFGYYICSFTDAMQDKNYPYRGPDISSFYYHHAPCHFAQTADYLFAQIEVASDDKIAFPYVRQQGYVWFTDRIFGKSGGRVFDDTDCRPILDKDAVRPDSTKVSTLLARSKNSIWAILYNDSMKNIDADIKLDSLSKTLKDAKFDEPIESYDGRGNKLDKTYSFFGDKSISIPAMGIVALKIPAKKYEDPSEKLGVLGADAHYKQAQTVENWGELHAFRIRGPFGKDSLYVLFTNGFEREKAKIVLNMEDGDSPTQVTCDRYPYEISIYPISPKKDIVFTVSVFEGDKEIFKSETITLKQ